MCRLAILFDSGSKGHHLTNFKQSSKTEALFLYSLKAYQHLVSIVLFSSFYFISSIIGIVLFSSKLGNSVSEQSCK